MFTMPGKVFSGFIREGHVQGIAVDLQGGCVYYSFTTLFLKTDLEGKPLGSVRHIAGHIGCITFDPDRRLVYGSLEQKHDAVGQGIIARTGWDPTEEDAFYALAFDVDKITRMDMDAETDGVMSSVYLADVVRDYHGRDPVSGKKHVFGCSGIDGTGYGPAFGTPADAPKKIMIAYGIYSEVNRTDNDCQVILQYDPSIFEVYGRPLIQSEPHHSGPETCERKYFFYTGNTVYGVQNLEYDAFSRSWLVAVYRGQKAAFGNYPLFLIDGSVPPVRGVIPGRSGEVGELLTSAAIGDLPPVGAFTPAPGVPFWYGQTGVASLGGGLFAFSHDGSREDEYYTNVTKYRLDETQPQLWVECL